jgi:hypothetical protein
MLYNQPLNQILNATQTNNSVNNSEYRIFLDETAVLSFRTIFWHILAEFKKNRWRRFFAKSQKPPKMAKNGIN